MLKIECQEFSYIKSSYLSNIGISFDSFEQNNNSTVNKFELVCESNNLFIYYYGNLVSFMSDLYLSMN